MRPAEGERHRAAVARRIGQLLVDGVAVALDDAGIPRQQSDRVHAASPGRIGVDHTRGIGPAPWAIISRDRPEVAGLGPAAARIEDRSPRLVDRDLGGAEQELLHPQIDRPELRRRDADPEGQRGAIDRQALQLHDLRLTVERIVPGEFVDHDAGHETFGRNTAPDQALGVPAPGQPRARRPGNRIWGDASRSLGIGPDSVETPRGLFPMTCIAPWQHGQTVLSSSIVAWTRGRCADSAPRLMRRFLPGPSGLSAALFCGSSCSA